MSKDWEAFKQGVLEEVIDYFHPNYNEELDRKFRACGKFDLPPHRTLEERKIKLIEMFKNNIYNWHEDYHHYVRKTYASYKNWSNNNESNNPDLVYAYFNFTSKGNLHYDSSFTEIIEEISRNQAEVYSQKYHERQRQHEIALKLFEFFLENHDFHLVTEESRLKDLNESDMKVTDTYTKALEDLEHKYAWFISKCRKYRKSLKKYLYYTTADLRIDGDTREITKEDKAIASWSRRFNHLSSYKRSSVTLEDFHHFFETFKIGTFLSLHYYYTKFSDEYFKIRDARKLEVKKDQCKKYRLSKKHEHLQQGSEVTEKCKNLQQCVISILLDGEKHVRSNLTRELCAQGYRSSSVRYVLKDLVRQNAVIKSDDVYQIVVNEELLQKSA